MKRVSKYILPILASVVLAPAAIAEVNDTLGPKLTSTLSAARAEAEWPGLTVREAAAKLGTAENALSFVRDGIASANYPGSYHGAAGTLRTRVANNTDKAQLLAALLNEQGFTTELHSGPRFHKEKVHIPRGLNRPRPALAALQSLVAPFSTEREERDHLEENESGADREEAELAALDKEVSAALAVVKGELAKLKWQAKGPEGGRPTSLAESSPSSLIWVRARRERGAWKDYDVFTDHPHVPAHPTAFEPNPLAVAMTIESVDAAGWGTPLLDWKGTTHDLAGYDIHLGWNPNDERILSADDLILPFDIAIAQWVPALRIGAKQIMGKPFSPSKVKTVRLRIVIQDDGNAAALKVRKFERIVQDFGPGFEQHEFLAVHRIGIAAAAVPANVIDARVLDELVDYHALNDFAAGGAAPKHLSHARGISTRTARIVNKMIATAAHLDPAGTQFTWNGPCIALETTRLQMVDGEITGYTLLDMVNQAVGPLPQSKVDLKMRWGLAVCAAEAQLLGGKSVNQQLTGARGKLQKIKRHEARGLVAQSIERGAVALTASSASSYAWTVHQDGTLLGIVSERPLLQAKGGRSQSDKVDTAAGAYAALGGAALSAGGASPLGPLVGGIAGYLNELRKVWGGITQRLEKIAQAIASGNTSGLTDGDEDLTNMAANLMRAMGQGYAEGYVKSAVSAGIGAGVGAGPWGRAGISGAVGMDFRRMRLAEREIRRVLRAFHSRQIIN